MSRRVVFESSAFADFTEWAKLYQKMVHRTTLISCHAFKLGMGSEQDAHTTRILLFLTLRFQDLRSHTLCIGEGALRYANTRWRRDPAKIVQ